MAAATGTQHVFFQWAIVVGLVANLPGVALYPLNSRDADGQVTRKAQLAT